MDPVAAAKSAANTLKGAQAAGKELGSVVTSQQADMENADLQENFHRVKTVFDILIEEQKIVKQMMMEKSKKAPKA